MALQSSLYKTRLDEKTLELLEQLFRLDGKVALVTGGCGGIGQVVVRGLAQAGAKIAIAGQNEEKATGAAKALTESGHESFASTFNVVSVSETRRMVDEVADHFGKIDILVNLIGLNREEKAEAVSEEAFDKVIDVNLKGMMFQAQAVARQMIKQGSGGKQVHTGSVRSLLGLSGRGYAAYCAAKGGMTVLCKQLAVEWAPHKVNVNLVAPTFVRTPQVETMLADQKFYNALLARIPQGRIGTPEDVLGAILFFVSPASEFITGQTMYLDGGLTATQ
jgi:NAD(P)-dependent dehydrogenase (short-subunit alcohol dehydrogenase family)